MRFMLAWNLEHGAPGLSSSRTERGEPLTSNAPRPPAAISRRTISSAAVLRLNSIPKDPAPPARFSGLEHGPAVCGAAARIISVEPRARAGTRANDEQRLAAGLGRQNVQPRPGRWPSSSSGRLRTLRYVITRSKSVPRAGDSGGRQSAVAVATPIKGSCVGFFTADADADRRLIPARLAICGIMGKKTTYSRRP